MSNWPNDPWSFSPEPPPARTGRGHTAALIVLLVVLSLALGAAVNWGLSHRRAGRDAAAALAALRMDQAIIAARQTQLAELLVDPHSELIRLHGTNHVTRPQVAIVWNGQRRLGMLFAEQLNPSDRQRQYQLWLRSAEGAVSGGVFDASATATLHVFRPELPLRGPVDFVVTLETAGGAEAPVGPVMFASGEK